MAAAPLIGKLIRKAVKAVAGKTKKEKKRGLRRKRLKDIERGHKLSTKERKKPTAKIKRMEAVLKDYQEFFDETGLPEGVALKHARRYQGMGQGAARRAVRKGGTKSKREKDLEKFDKWIKSSPVGKRYAESFLQEGGQVIPKKNRMSRVGLSPAEEARAGTEPEAERRRYNKGGDVKVAGRGSKKGKPSRPKPQKPPKMTAQHGGMVQGYDARKDEQLGMTRGPERDKKVSMAARREDARTTRKPKGTYGLVRRAKGGPIGVRAALRGHGAVRKT
jgi:hypothetical protein